MAVITPIPKTQFIGADGVPLVGGKVYTYAAGTTTPQSTYTDNSGASANTNPIILDSRGEADIWLGESTYKFKLTDSNDVEQWTVDYISAPTTALSPVLSGNVTISSDSSGPALKITQTGTGYVMRVQDSIDPDLTPFVINSAGYVGLGTTAPAEALDIDNNGKIQFSSNGTPLTVISADATNSTIDVKDARNLVLKTNGAARATIASNGITTLANQLVISSGGTAITGNSTVTGTFGATGTITSSTGNLVSTAGSVSAGTTVTAGTSVTATTSVITNTISERTAASNVTINGVPVVYNSGTSYIGGDYLRMSSKTVQATTSGTSFSFTDIPSWARRITVMFSEVSLSGTDNILVQIGPGTVATSGYLSTSVYLNSALAAGSGTSSSGFAVVMVAGGNLFSGTMVITLVDPAAYSYVATHNGRLTTAIVVNGGGSVTLSGLATALTITRSGTNTFDAGSVNIFYE